VVLHVKSLRLPAQVVGNGATAVQVVGVFVLRSVGLAHCSGDCRVHLWSQVPELAKIARQVTIIQRSPMWVAKKSDFAYPAFVRWAFRNVPLVYAIYRSYLFLFNETMYLIVFHWQWTAKIIKFGLRKVRRCLVLVGLCFWRLTEHVVCAVHVQLVP
jgi:hypothetical protein